jgi:hypothetical protein
MAKNLLAAVCAFGVIFSSVARADDSVPQGSPASLVPAELNVIAGLDLPQLRAAGPAETVNMLIDGLKPLFAKVGADPNKLGLAVFGVAPKKADAKSPTVLIADLPVDRTELEKQMNPPFTSGEYQGTKIRRNKTGAYAVLPHDRLVMAEGIKIERVLDVARGKGAALVDKDAAALLRSIGAPGGRGPAFFAWLKFSAFRDSLGSNGTPLDGVTEGVVSLTTGTNGADLKVIGRSATKEDAAKTADALRALVANAAKDSTVAMMGLTPVVNAVKIETAGESTNLSLHLTKAQYVDLVTRLAGLAQASIEQAKQNMPDPSNAPTDEVRVKPKAKTPQ